MKSNGTVDALGLVAVFGAMVWLLSLCHCGPTIWTPPEPVPVVGDACERACARGAELGCVFAEPTPEGATCVDVCRDTEATGWTSMHPECVAVASSCEEASRVSADGCE